MAFTATSPRTAVGDPSNLGLDYAGIIWRSTTVAPAVVTIDLGADKLVDTIVLFGLAGTLSAATWQVYASTAVEGPSARPRTTGAAPLLAGADMPVSGKGVALTDLPGGWPAVRYLTIEASLPSGALEISRAVIGKRLKLRRNFGFGGAFGVRDLGTLDFSARGVLLRRRAKKLRTVALTFSAISRDEVETQTRPLMEEAGSTELVALITDPSPHADRQNRCYFGPLVGDLANVQRNSAGWEAKINLASVF